MKRLLSILLFVFILLSLAPFHKTHAATWVFDDFATCVEEGILREALCKAAYFLSGYDDYLKSPVLYILGAVRGVTVTEDAYERNPSYVQRLNQGSAIASISRTIALFYENPPATTGLAIRDFGQTLGFLPNQAYAQGVGFNGLVPLLPIWKVFRDIAYLILAIIMIGVGFMVMFRKKIDPKTVVTVQNALPRIIISLLLITFSYAIVGFMIDLMYLAILLIVATMSQAGIATGSIQSTMATGSLWDLIGAMFPNGGFTLGRLAFEVTGGWQTAGISALITGLLGALVAWNPAGLILGVAGGAAPSVLVTLVLSIALLFGFLRLFFILLNSYIQIILALIIGPIQLLMDAIPGAVGFSSWIRNLFVNLLAFPITATMFLLAMLFSRHAIQGEVWSPPYLISNTASGTVISALFSLGILLSIPQVINAVKEALKAKPALPIGPGNIFGVAAAGGRLAFEEILRARQTRILKEALIEREKPVAPGEKELKP